MYMYMYMYMYMFMFMFMFMLMYVYVFGYVYVCVRMTRHLRVRFLMLSTNCWAVACSCWGCGRRVRPLAAAHRVLGFPAARALTNQLQIKKC